MVRKVVRDIKKTGELTISLDGKEVSVKAPKRSDTIDCSTIGKRKNVITGRGRNSIRDLSKKRDEKEQVFFFQIDSTENLRYAKTSELIRLAAAGLVILVVLNIINIYNRGLTLKNDIIATAYSGYEDLISAGEMAQLADFTSAGQTFSQAADNFNSAIEEIDFLKNHQSYFLTTEKTVDSAEGLLDAAKNISLAGKNFAKGIESLKLLPSLFIYENSMMINGTAEDTEKQSLTDQLKTDLAYVQTATEQINIAKQKLEKVAPDVLPPGFREKLGTVREKIDSIHTLLVDTQEKIPAILNMLGDRYPHRYLILLQNDSEARPTGGFIGSYLIVDLNDGYITKFEFHDVYELDGQFYEYIEPPEDIAMVSENWRMRDSNYSPDFTVSAEKAAWFLQKEKGPSVDSVVALNLSFIEDLLSLTGPMQISSLQSPIDKDSFQLVLSYIVESKLSGVENPKEIMKELIPAFQKKIASDLPLDKLFLQILKGINQKQIMLYSRHENVLSLFDDISSSNRVLQTGQKEDYLQVVVTSIGGNKSDRFVNQTINHFTLIQNDGTVTNELVLTRQHTWDGKDLLEWQHILENFGFNDLPPHIIDILGRGKNKAFIKVYVPEGSRLIDSTGISKEEVYVRNDEEINKTYFMFKMEVEPLSTEKVSITYGLPENLSFYPADTYKFTAQNQPAYKPGYLEKKIYFKPGLKSYRHYPDALKEEEDGSLFYSSEFNGDVYLSALVGT